MNYNDYGTHRVVSPAGSLPQGAQKLSPQLPIAANEILISVDTLNIDSASFKQIVTDVGADESRVAERILSIVRERGKMQNPVTGSGGMLLGTVQDIGPSYRGPSTIKVGARIATLVSLTLTPLEIRRIKRVVLDADQVDVEGHAILWPSSPIVAMPEDMEETLALACLDVCGAPAQTKRLVQPGMKVAVIGAGKSGLLCLAQARESMAGSGRLVAVDLRGETLAQAESAGYLDAWGTCNARDPVASAEIIESLLGSKADLVINTANVDQTEMSAILAVRDGGTVYFFNMATSFARAALGAEGVGRDANLIIGNGFAHGHADLTLDLVRRHAFLQNYFRSVVGAR